jgi:hypothetical protein
MISHLGHGFSFVRTKRSRVTHTPRVLGGRQLDDSPRRTTIVVGAVRRTSCRCVETREDAGGVAEFHGRRHPIRR